MGFLHDFEQSSSKFSGSFGLTSSSSKISSAVIGVLAHLADSTVGTHLSRRAGATARWTLILGEIPPSNLVAGGLTKVLDSWRCHWSYQLLGHDIIRRQAFIRMSLQER